MHSADINIPFSHMKTAIALVQNARHSIFFTCYRYRPGKPAHPQSPERFIIAVLDAIPRGVQVTAVIERGNGGDRRYISNHRLALELRHVGATVIVPPRTRVIHAKVLVVDSRYLLITSGNLTLASATRNIEYSCLIDDVNLAQYARFNITAKATAHA